MAIKSFTNLLVSLLLFTHYTDCTEIYVTQSYGQTLVLECSPNEHLEELQTQIEELFQIPAESQTWTINGNTLNPFGSLHTLIGKIEVSTTADPRNTAKDYYLLPNKDDEKNITYMIKTLADKSLPALAFCRGDLQDAGDAVAHLHPLRFFEVVFTNEELKVGIRNMKKRKQIWPEFASGMANSFKNEAAVGNMKKEYLEEFAAKVGLDLSKVLPLAENGKWLDFLNGLVLHIPRIGEFDKYDM